MNAPIEYIIYKINILKKSTLTIIAITILGVFFVKGFAFGFLVGGLIALGKFSLLAKHVLQIREFSLRKAKVFIILRFLLMYVIMASALFIAATKSMSVLLGVACGLLVVQAVILVDSLWERNVRAGTN